MKSPFGLALCTAGLCATLNVSAKVSSVPSQVFYGEAIHAFSENGVWMVSTLDSDRSQLIRNLETGKTWKYTWAGGDFDENYPESIGPHAVSNDGVVVGEVSDVPSYWTNGEWHQLKGWLRNSYGQVTAIVGGITADGSMIVGGMGRGSSPFDEDGRQMTYPCVWHRQVDGSYGDPEWLPVPGRDFFGLIPQYLHCTDVSADGSTIGAIMRCWNGFWNQPYSYTRDEKGEWVCRELGYELINPTGMEIMTFPGEYDGPSYPNYELFMTEEQLHYFYWVAGPEWISDLYDKGITDEMEIAILELSFAREFMDEDRREEYDRLLQPFLDEYVPWWEKYSVYEQFLETLGNSGVDFLYNNVFVSPDGKYVVSPATGNRGTYPVRFDAHTGEYVVYESRGITPTVICDDYSVIAMQPDYDKDMYRNAYIYPGLSTKAVAITDFWKQQGMMENYDWMEENMYRSVVVSLTASGAEQYDDRWCVGIPMATPDMTLMAFGCSQLYWEVPASSKGIFVNHLLNTGYDISAVESIEADASRSLLTATGRGTFVALEAIENLSIYDLAGTLVFSASDIPAGIISTALSGGVYIIRAITPDGHQSSLKARL